MNKLALIIYSTLSGAGESAVYRAMMFAQELQRAGDDGVLVFDGAGTQALAELLRSEHDLCALFEKVRPQVRGACRACAKAYEVLDRLTAAGVPLLADDRGHASLRKLLLEDRQLVTF